MALRGKLQDKVELPILGTLIVVKVQDAILVPRLTRPENPFKEFTTMVEVPVEPASTLMIGCDGVIVKSWTVKVRLV